MKTIAKIAKANKSMKIRAIMCASFISLSVCFVYSCKHKSSRKLAETTLFHVENQHLVKEIFDSTGQIRLKQYYNKDTTPDGSMTEYYHNGNISIWRWFSYEYPNPFCGIFYRNDATFDTLKGDALIAVTRDSNKNITFKLVNPPNINFIIKIVDYYQQRKVKELFYEPIKTDSVCWVPIGPFDFKKNHNYTFVFCLVDTVKKQILYEFPKNIAQ